MGELPMHNNFENRVLASILHTLVIKKIITTDEARQIYQHGYDGGFDSHTEYIWKQ